MEKYDEAVKVIKAAILQSQYDAARSVNEKQLALYFCIGKYISLNSRKGFWGTGAIDAISERLDQELPGLRGFTSRNLRYMRSFYEAWSALESAEKPLTITEEQSNHSELANSKMEPIRPDSIWNLQIPNSTAFPFEAFFQIGFTHHRIILGKVKEIDERLFYIQHCAKEHCTVEELKASITRDDFHHQGNLPNNFLRTLPASEQAFRAVNTFKDEYLLDFINVEELNVRDKQDTDERVVENAIIHNVKNFILTFGKDFAFIRNQYHLDALEKINTSTFCFSTGS